MQARDSMAVEEGGIARDSTIIINTREQAHPIFPLMRVGMAVAVVSGEGTELVPP